MVALGSLVMGLNVALGSVPEGQTVLVSQSRSGVYSNDDAYIEAMSDDGERVAFTSMASKLVLGDTNGTFDVFVHDDEMPAG